MMKFEKVSFNQYCKDVGGDCNLRDEYNDIKIPQRATKFSAGYDFFMPFGCSIEPNETLTVPTGIRWVTTYNYRFMSLYPRSSLGFKYQLGMSNTIPVIDADYYNSDNEGHIFIKLVNRGDKTVSLKQGESFAQGIIMEYQRVDDDTVSSYRNGGIGSTSVAISKKGFRE